MRHFGPRPPTGDHLDQLIAIEMGLVQICGSAGRARIAAAVTVDAMAELTVRLVLEQTLPERCVLCKRHVERQQQRCRHDGHGEPAAGLAERTIFDRCDSFCTHFPFLQCGLVSSLSMGSRWTAAPDSS